MTRPGTLGSGNVTYHPDRPIVHFGSPADVTYADTRPTPSSRDDDACIERGID